MYMVWADMIMDYVYQPDCQQQHMFIVPEDSNIKS